jgi:hypothetical protein
MSLCLKQDWQIIQYSNVTTCHLLLHVVKRSTNCTVHQLAGSCSFSVKPCERCPLRDVFDWIKRSESAKKADAYKLDGMSIRNGRKSTICAPGSRYLHTMASEASESTMYCQRRGTLSVREHQRLEYDVRLRPLTLHLTHMLQPILSFLQYCVLSLERK